MVFGKPYQRTKFKACPFRNSKNLQWTNVWNLSLKGYKTLNELPK